MIHQLNGNDDVLKVFSIEEYKAIMKDVTFQIIEHQKDKIVHSGNQGCFAAMSGIERSDLSWKFFWIEVLWEKVSDNMFIVSLSNMIVTDTKEELMDNDILDRYNVIKKEMKKQSNNPLENLN